MRRPRPRIWCSHFNVLPFPCSLPSLFFSSSSSTALFLISGMNALFSYVFNFPPSVWRGQESDRGHIRGLSHEDRPEKSERAERAG